MPEKSGMGAVFVALSAGHARRPTATPAAGNAPIATPQRLRPMPTLIRKIRSYHVARWPEAGMASAQLARVVGSREFSAQQGVCHDKTDCSFIADVQPGGRNALGASVPAQ